MSCSYIVSNRHPNMPGRLMKSDWDILVDYVSGATPPEDRPRVERWAREQPARGRMLADLQALWSARLPGADPETGWADLSARLEKARRSAGQERTQASRPPLNLVTDAAEEPRPSRRRRRPWLLHAAAIACVLIGGGVTGRAVLKPTSGEDIWADARTFTTARGEVARVTLPDGTAVVLGVQSRLLVSSTYGGTAREVRLSGQGYFDVTTDVERPFTVHTAAASARVLGTEFVVTSRDSAAAQVVVAEGRVAVRSTSAAEDETTELMRGQRAQLTAERSRVEVDAVDPAQFVGWMEGRLVFEDMRMADILEELERWYDIDFRVEPAHLRARRMNASFDRPSLKELLHGLALAADVTYRVGDRTVTFVPKP